MVPYSEGSTEITPMAREPPITSTELSTLVGARRPLNTTQPAHAAPSVKTIVALPTDTVHPASPVRWPMKYAVAHSTPERNASSHHGPA
ncbi:hypothetical protein DVJ78_07100 [Humibacter sp. BT305]|nr:hypothetical protein DVJ78_07100 [Humibacter sp. BT305]